MGSNVLRLYTSHIDTLQTFEGSHQHKLIPQVLALKSPKLIEVDDVVVSQSGGGPPHWPFKDAMAYYEYASSHKSLPGIKVPYLAINAEDDPIVRVIPRPDEPGVPASGWVAVAVTKYGGHLGWFEDGDLRFEVRRWIKEPVLQWIKVLVDEFIRDPGQGGRETEIVDGFTREIGRNNIGFKEVDGKDLPQGPNVEGLTTGL
jgi:predicted alpha/beta-fold hydrolase